MSGRKYFYTFLHKPARLPVTVISIGNLTLGGTGKTPAVISVCEEAIKRGYQPCVLTRGYKGRAKGPCFVSRGKRPLLSVQDSGDEPYMMAERLRDTPIVLGKNRYESGLFALEHFSPYISEKSEVIFILDDGYQHISLYRDRDVLLIDTAKPIWLEKLFPEGRLREHLKEIVRADIIVLTKADMVSLEVFSKYKERIRQFNRRAPIYSASHAPVSVINMSGEEASLITLKGSRVYAFSGIARPSHFKTLLVSQGADIRASMDFGDHHVYNQRDIDRITEDASGLKIITTEKDMVKLRQLKHTDGISALRVAFSIDEAFYDKLFQR